MKKTTTRIAGVAVGGTALIAAGLVALLTSPSAHAATRRPPLVYPAIQIGIPESAPQSCKDHAVRANHYARITAHQQTLAAETSGTAHARHHSSAVTYGRLAGHQRQLAVNNRCRS